MKIIHIGKEVEKYIFDNMVSSLKDGKVVKLGKIGTFRLLKLKSRKSTHVNTGERITVKSQYTIKFKLSDTIKKLIQ